MTFSNPELQNAYDTLNAELSAGNIVVDEDRLEEVAKSLSRVKVTKSAVSLKDVGELEDRLGIMLTAAVGEDYLNDQFAKHMNTTSAGGSVLNADAFYAAMKVKFKTEGRNILDIWGHPLNEFWTTTLTDEGKQMIEKMGRGISEYLDFKKASSDSMLMIEPLPYSSFVAGELIFSTGQTIPTVDLFGNGGLRGRIADIGFENKQWVAGSFVRWNSELPGLSFSDADQLTVYPSSSVCHALEKYGIVKRWNETTKKPCTIALAHGISQSSGMSSLDLDLHLYQFGEK